MLRPHYMSKSGLPVQKIQIEHHVSKVDIEIAIGVLLADDKRVNKTSVEDSIRSLLYSKGCNYSIGGLSELVGNDFDRSKYRSFIALEDESVRLAKELFPEFYSEGHCVGWGTTGD